MICRGLKKIIIAVLLNLFVICPIFTIPFLGNEINSSSMGLAFAQTAEDYFQLGKTNFEDYLLTEAYNNFQTALTLDPNHQGANLFYALTRLLMISKSTDFNTLLDRTGMSSSGRDIFDWTADFTRDPEGRIILPSNSPTGAELQAFLKNNILPEVNGALDNLSKVNSSFETIYKLINETGSGAVNGPNTLTDTTKYWGYNEWVGYKLLIGGIEYTITGNTGNTITVSPNWTISPATYNYKIFEGVEIDYGDVLILKGSLYFAKGGIFIISSYNVNIDIDTIVSLYKAGTLNFQNHIINTYTQLLTLLPDQQLSQAKSAMREAIDIFTLAINFIVAETDPQDNDLFIIDDPLKEQEYRNLLADLNGTLDGTRWVRKFEIYLNLLEFFDHPKDLRNYLPIFRGKYFIQRGSFPDPTFGGILPYMTASELDEKVRSWGLFLGPMGIVDFDGDGTTDVAAFHLPTDQFFTDYAGNLGQFGWGGSDSMPLIWDYDGDGKTDVSIYHIPTNQWFVKGVGNLGQFGWGGEESVPVPGDYNGDGRMERAFYHSPTNRWFVEGQDPVTFGWNGAECIPVPGDYDGDGKTDMVIYHIPSNQWFQYGVGNLGQFGWGGADCIPVPGDYNGDGKTEIAVYHIPTNQWFVKGIGNLGQYGWGGLESFPIPGDYDGDGMMERGFYRPSENRWFIEGESDFVWGWGGSEFMPITSQIAVYNWFRFMLGRFQ